MMYPATYTKVSYIYSVCFQYHIFIPSDNTPTFKMKWFKTGLFLATVQLSATLVTGYKVLDASEFVLRVHPDYYTDLIVKLDDALPNVSIDEVIADTNHDLKPYSSPPNFVQAFT